MTNKNSLFEIAKYCLVFVFKEGNTMKKICCALALIVTLCAGHTAGAITATLYKETDYGRIIPETRITTAGTNKTESVFSNRGAFIIAKAVKLGRGNAYSVAADATVDTGKTEIA